MALQKEVLFKGLTISQGYYKVNRISSIVDVLVDGVKKYNLHVSVSLSNTKEAEALEEKQYPLSGLEESELTYAGIYGKLKEIEDFSGSVDV